MKLSDTEENLQSMVDLAKANKMAVVLCSVTPSAEFWWHKGLEPSTKIQTLNSWLKNFAMENHYPYVDYYSMPTAPSMLRIVLMVYIRMEKATK